MSIIKQIGHQSVFGEQIVTEIVPLIQISCQYGLNPVLRDDIDTTEFNGGLTDTVSNMFHIHSGTSLGGKAVVSSKESANYRAGQALQCRLTAMFTAGVAGSRQLAGFISQTSALAFGYDGIDFGLMHYRNGVLDIHTLTVTGVAGGAETATITINGDSFTANLTNTTTAINARQIADAANADPTIYANWTVEELQNKVIFVAKTAGARAGTYSFVSSTATATLIETTAGQAFTESHIHQDSWDNQPFSGFDPTKLNLYKIEFGWLGAVNIKFFIYNPNSSDFDLVHEILWAGNNLIPSLDNPNMKIGWSSESISSTGTDLHVRGASAFAGNLGKHYFSNQTWAVDNLVSAVGVTKTALITIANRISYGDRVNQGRIELVDVSVTNDHTKGATVFVYVNASLGGFPAFEFVNETNSIAVADKSGTTVTGGALVASRKIPAGGTDLLDLTDYHIFLYPGDQITVVATTESGTSTSISATVSFTEQK